MTTPHSIREIAMGPGAREQNLEAQVRVMRGRLTDLRAFVAGQVGAFGPGPHAQGSDTMAARVVAEIDVKFRGIL